MKSNGREYNGPLPHDAECVHCGYHFGGIAIHHGLVVCPECGEASRFSHDEAIRKHVKFKPIVATLAALYVATVLLWWTFIGSLVNAVFAATLVTILVMPITLRRMLRDASRPRTR